MVKLAGNGQTKKRLRRQWRRRRRDAVELSQQADQGLEKLLLRRLNRLAQVRRFVGLWLTLFVVLAFGIILQLRSLSPYYQVLVPAPGGLYSEGLVGSFTNANPLYANDAADSAVSHLVFSGLFKYDTSNNLVGDLATSWTVDDKQTTYTVNLRPNVKWQDGQAFTADDVVFTYDTIQNIEAQSPFYTSWQGITVSKVNDLTVTFSLPNPLNSFVYSLTNGIVPAHLLSQIPAAQLRSAAFNTAPVGTGPFKWKFVDVTGDSDTNRQQRITLAAYDHYYAGRPELDGFSLVTYRGDQQMVQAFESKQIDSIGGLDSTPPELASDGSLQVYHVPLTAISMAFFNNSNAPLNDFHVRQALVSSIDRSGLLSVLTYPHSLVASPLLPGQVGYDPNLNELPYSLSFARQALDNDGWTVGAHGLRYKAGQLLSLNLVTQDTPEYTTVSQYLQQQWLKLGVQVNVRNLSPDDLLGTTIPNHDYDILLYGISISPSGDIFAYWDSSQANVDSQGHLNLSEYQSSVADQALESARLRASPSLRAIKYQAFLRAWRQDAPALALYQPDYLYISRGPVFGFERASLNVATDRFYNVANWEIRQQKQKLN